MRKELFYNPRLLWERLATVSCERRRLARLRGTPAAGLTRDHIDSLELLELLRPLNLNVIYDVGANVGTWTRLAKAIFPKTQIHAFEPMGAHQAAFMANTKQLSDVHLHTVALGATACTTQLHVTSFSDASSVLPLADAGESQWHICEVGNETVQVESLDDYQQQGCLPFASLLKLDVQGYELNVLHGAMRCLKHVEAVLTEVSFREFYRGQCLFHDVVTFLADQGLTLFALGNGTALGRSLVQTDALFTTAHAATVCRQSK